ncbi:MAG: hypothetical protein S4CHLAM7_00800 [Chlamydiae bacterium]|nr:hypothetical protein [Chlamydiota bacterium]
MQKKLYFLFVFTVALTSLFLWRKPLTLSVTRLAVNFISEKSLGKRIDFESLKFEKGRIVLIAPEFGGELDTFEAGGLFLKANKAIINYDLSWLHKSLKLEVELVDLHCKVVKKEQTYDAIKNLFSSKINFIQIKTLCKIDKGQIELIEEDQIERLNFSVEMAQVAASNITHFTFYDNQSLVKGFLQKKEDSLECKIELDELEARSLIKTTNYVFNLLEINPLPIQDATGKIRGSVSMLFLEGYLPMTRANLEIAQLDFKDFISNLNGTIPNISISLETLNRVSPSQLTPQSVVTSLLQNSYGSIAISQGASLHQKLLNETNWEFENLKGKLTFSSEKPSKLNLEGHLKVQDQKAEIDLNGAGLFTLPRGDLQVSIKNFDKQESLLNLSINPQGDHKLKVSMGISHFNESEMILVKPLLSYLYSDLNVLDFYKGELDAQLFCILEKGKLKKVCIDEFLFSDVSTGPFASLGKIEGLFGSGNINLSFDHQYPLKTAEGELRFQAKSIDLYQQNLKDFRGTCRVQGGKLEYAKIYTQVSEIDTHLEWKIDRKGEPLFLEIKALGKHFLPHLPGKIADVYQKDFAREEIRMQFKGVYLKDKAKCTAKCFVSGQSICDFGFSLIHQSDCPEISEEFKLFQKAFLFHTKILPTLKEINQIAPSKLKLSDGWLKSKQIPVEKYLSPAIFGQTSIKLKGYADLNGTFNDSVGCIEYSNYQFDLEHEDIHLKITDPGELGEVGKHYFNFRSNNHFGHLNIREGSCLVKGCNIQFDKLRGSLCISPNCLYAPGLKTFSKNIPLQADLKINFLGEGGFKLQVFHPFLEGKFSDFKCFFNAFGTSSLENLPFEGDVLVHPERSYFELNKSSNYSNYLKIDGTFSNGQALKESSFELSKIKSSFFYDSEKGVFQLEDASAKWDVGFKKSCLIESDHLKLDFKDYQPTPFNLRIKDEYLDLAKFDGSIRLSPNQGLSTLKLVLEKEKNYFGDVIFNHLNLNIKENKVEYLHLDFTSDCKSFNEDLNLLSQFIKTSNLREFSTLNPLPLNGEVSGQWIYNRSDGRHQFFIWGDRVRIGEGSASPFHCKGYYQAGHIFLDELHYQNLNASFKIEDKPQSYLIHYFRVQQESSLYLDLSGVYSKQTKSFHSHLHKFYCDLQFFNDFFQLGSNYPLAKCSGRVAFKGQLEGGCVNGLWKYIIDLEGKTKELNISEVIFEDAPLSIKLEKDHQSVNVSYLQAKIKSLFKQPFPLDIQAKNLLFKNNLTLDKAEKIDFKMPVRALRESSELLESKFNFIPSKILVHIKESGNFEGNACFNRYENDYPLLIQLKDDFYYFKNKPYFLKKLKCRYGPQGVCVGAEILYNSLPYWLEVKKDSYDLSPMLITLFENNPQSEDLTQNSSIKFKCVMNEKEPVLVSSVHGKIGGVKVDFVNKTNKGDDKQVFMGQIQVNEDDFLKRIPQSLSKQLKRIGLKTGYFLSGQLKMSSQNPQDFSFEGLLGGQDFDFLGYEFKSLSSKILLNASHMLISDLKISDLSGQISIPKVEILKKEEGYYFEVPKIHLSEFKPSLLHQKGSGPKKHKPLIIQSLDLLNFKGNLLDPSTIAGTGSLKFLKSPKKQNSLLDIPAHLISKLGLDLTMLNPVEGKILYEIRDQKIHFTRFVDVYSHDKNCYFQIFKSPEGSYLDFNGNLNIQIKMKQFVLLKITEPFMISIQGNCMNPKYSFRRKKVKVDVPQRVSQ